MATLKNNIFWPLENFTAQPWLAFFYFKGEVSYLRGELTKRESNHAKEKQDLAQALEAKNLQLKEVERTRLRDLEAVKADLDFNKRELEQAIEMIEKLKRQKSDGFVASQQTQNNHATSAKRPSLESASSRLTKKPKLASNIDEWVLSWNPLTDCPSKSMLTVRWVMPAINFTTQKSRKTNSIQISLA